VKLKNKYAVIGLVLGVFMVSMLVGLQSLELRREQAAQVAQVAAPAQGSPQGQVPTPPSLSTAETEPLTPMAYLPDGTSVDVVTLLGIINDQRGRLADDPFFAWLHSYLAQTTIRGTMWVRVSDAPMGSVSWLQRDSRPQMMLMGCRDAVPLGYHDITLTTSNVICLNGECAFMAMPLSIDGQ
jgi:hypothetical protein